MTANGPKHNRTVSFTDLVDVQPSITRPRRVSFNTSTEHVKINLANQPVEPDERKPDTPLSYTELYLASTYIIDARFARSYKHKVEEQYLQYYALYNTALLTYALYFFLLLNLSLALFEEPAVNNLSLPYWSTMCMEFMCLGYFTFRLAHSKIFVSGINWWTDPKNLVTMSVIVLMLIDILIYTVLKATAHENAVRWSRCLRPLFLVNFAEMRQLRRSFRNIRRTLPEILYVLILLFIVIGLFALLMRELFTDEDLVMLDGVPYMTNYWDNIWHLYVLVTTANSPDIMMPAYDKNPWNVLIFIAYIIICIYILMSIFLAVIYKNYRKHLKNEVQRSVFSKRRQLSRAFDILKVSNGDNSYFVPWARWKAVMKLVIPRRSEVLVRLLWDIIDQDEDGKIERAEFLRVSDLLNMEISEVKDRIPLIGRTFPRCYQSKLSEIVKECVRSPIFRYFFDVVITVNALCIGFRLDQAEWLFLTLFTMEITLKLYTLGAKQFFKKPWNVFDFFVIMSALIASIVELALNDDNLTEDTLDFLLVLRVLRLVRIIAEIKRFQVILATVANIGPSILSFGAVIFVLYYIFAIIGMEVFGNKITYFGYPDIYEDPSQEYCGNIKLKDSEFYREHYCHNNFNNIINSMIVLMELTIVNQWHVLASGFVAVTHKSARIFFILFHMSIVIVVVNIFIAFILEVFMVEYSLSTNNFESIVEHRINELGLGVTEVTEGEFEAQSPKRRKRKARGTDKDDLIHNASELANDQDHIEANGHAEATDGQVIERGDVNSKLRDDGVRFKLTGRTRNVEVVLQRMFEGELDGDDMGPEDIQNIDDLEPEDMASLPVTFENIT
ncbi:uncharacterized protein [Antedon mediterranea]|uniref:uncharacterized protein n=1 Tax=Antedon mediterranea TaxID=105859 RepID=UPI003AF9B09C